MTVNSFVGAAPPRHIDLPAGVRIVTANPLTMAVATALGVVVNYLGFLVIRATSSLTLKVLAHVRNVSLVMLSALAMGDARYTPTQVLGYALSLMGVAAYNAVKLGYFEARLRTQPPLAFAVTSADSASVDATSAKPAAAN